MSHAFARKLAAALLNLILVVLAGGFAAAALVRYSPGFDIDENAWSPKITAQTQARIREHNRLEAQLPVFYIRYLAAAVHGDFGVSQSFRQPVADLLLHRAAVSLKLISGGALGGFVLGSFCAWLGVWPGYRALDLLSSSLNGFLIAIPPAVLALAFFFREAPLELAIALAVAPRIFSTLRESLRDLHSSPALLAARARGIRSAGVAVQYVLLPASGPLVAVAGVAVVLALGCIIPVEALCDVPGIGQLAWKAALARDLPLLSALALIITFAVSAVHAVGEVLR